MKITVPGPNGDVPLLLTIYETPDPIIPSEQFLARCRFAATGERSTVFHVAPTRESLIANVETFYRDQFAKLATAKPRGRPKKVAEAAQLAVVEPPEVI